MRVTFRARILLLTIAIGVAPVALISLWLTGSAARSGEALLRTRLQNVLDENATAIERGWILYRSALLDVGDEPDVQRVLRSAHLALQSAPPAVQARFEALGVAIEAVDVHDRNDAIIWQLGRTGDALTFHAFGEALKVDVPLLDAVSGEKLGSLQARVLLNALRSSSGTTAAAGALITALDPASGALLLPAPFEPGLLREERFRWSGDEWITLRRTVGEPRLELVAAAPLTPFAAPFREASKRGTLLLLMTATIGIAAAVLLTTRLTGSLERLAAAAAAVSSGDLARRVDVRSNDEVGKVASAFNGMTENLRRTLDQLAERESLAAVNEFAAALAHEVRNPLTAIQLDLQEVEEGLSAHPELRALQGRALEDLRRLDRTVAAALDTARSGRVELREMDLREAIATAAHAAAPVFAMKGARIEWHPPGEAILIRGDSDALARVFLNLLRNAAESLTDGLETGALIEVRDDRDGVVVSIRDFGRGIPAEHRARIFDPFFTTRAGGTGVGLPVARRIVHAHHGSLHIESEPGQGTTVEVRLPTDVLVAAGTE